MRPYHFRSIDSVVQCLLCGVADKTVNSQAMIRLKCSDSGGCITAEISISPRRTTVVSSRYSKWYLPYTGKYRVNPYSCMIQARLIKFDNLLFVAVFYSTPSALNTASSALW